VTGTVTLVPMTGAHIDALMPYEHEMFGTEAWSADGYRAEIADTATRWYVVAEDADGALLGWAGVRVIGDEAEVLTVGVVPAARRRGTGARLLAALLEHARGRGARTAFLEVRIDNDDALSLYEREGFSRVGVRRGYYAGGRVDAVVMRRDITEVRHG
jgi:ribosomal-protein-alanine N-acetyltransferase